ncbi:MAG: BREX system ATP-binding domain-containing protein [Candidatus Binataceae bacterium]
MSDERQAIEALRAGVPNRAAIRLLGTAENEIRERFLENLEFCQRRLKDGGEPASGQVIAGGFGAGKSHLLGYLQEVALNQNFIVSRVVISKETPLFDLSKLYVSAIRSATVPHLNDDAMTAVLSKLRHEGGAYDDLAQWAENGKASLSPLFAALLHLLPHANTDPERVKHIARFLSGGKLGFANVRQWLREIGGAKRFPFKPVKQAELFRQRLRFVPRLIAAAGYSGWVLLLDEVELIGRYSVLQRGRAYAELARWLNLDAEQNVPGVVTVAAITDDFTSEVIDKRCDDQQVPLKLAGKNERKNAERARLGMETLARKQVLLKPPDAALLEVSLQKIRAFYADAYGWDVTAADVGEITAAKSMRQYIKSWITTWDLERLYGTRPEIETVNVAPNYEENKDIELAAERGDSPDE